MAAPKVLQYVKETFKDTCIKVKLMLTLNKMLSFSGQQVQLSRNLSLNLFVFVLKLMTNWYISTPLLLSDSVSFVIVIWCRSIYYLLCTCTLLVPLVNQELLFWSTWRVQPLVLKTEKDEKKIYDFINLNSWHMFDLADVQLLMVENNLKKLVKFKFDLWPLII